MVMVYLNPPATVLLQIHSLIHEDQLRIQDLPRSDVKLAQHVGNALSVDIIIPFYPIRHCLVYTGSILNELMAYNVSS